MKRIILFVVVIVVLGGGIYLYKRYTAKVPSLIDLKTEEKIAATDLIAAFEKDSSNANNKFLGKILEVDGMIKNIDQESSTVALGDSTNTSSVRCSMDSSFVKTLTSLNLGSKLTIKGACTGFMPDETGLGLGSDVVLNRCVIEKK